MNGNLPDPTDASLYSTKQDHLDYEPIEIPKFLKDNGKKFLSQFALAKKENQYKWKRLSEVYNIKDLNIIKESKNGNLADDVQQGELEFVCLLVVLGHEV